MKIKRAGEKIWLSCSALALLDDCPRCFWLKYKKGMVRPEGIVSRLPSRFDRVIKNYFHFYRRRGTLPPIIADKLKGRLEYPFQETYFYSINQKYGFYGKLDECLITPEETYSVIDFKTASSDPEKRDEIFPAYQIQLNGYAFLLEARGKKTSGIGYLIYFYPKDSERLEHGFPMKIYVKRVKTNPDLMAERLAGAVEILEGDMPGPTEDCSFCQWCNEVNKIF